MTMETFFESDDLVIGISHCDSADVRFRDPVSWPSHAFLFPRTVTAIDYAGGPSVTANPTAVLLYNQNQRYVRRAISGKDTTVCYLVSDALVLQLLAPHETRTSLVRPFRLIEAAPTAATLLEERLLIESLRQGAPDIHDRAVAMLGTVLQSAYDQKRRGRATEREIDGVELVREWIARNPIRNASLAELSALAGLPPMKLCRAFRQRTGLTLTRYRHELRGCLALDTMSEDSRDLLDIALALGYSSHSHFTYVFRKIFGVTPSVARASLAGAGEVVACAARSDAHASR
jgi:AraC-like DNA-binding protein